MSVDLSDIDSTYKYTVTIVDNAVMECYRALDKRFANPKLVLKTRWHALKANFAIEQIWERMTQPERDLLFPELTPHEIVSLRESGCFKKVKDGTDK